LLCFKPPYLYLILNAIIISILATSRFHHHSPPPDPTPSPLPSPPDHQFPQNDIADPTHPPVLEVNGSAAVDEEEEDVKEIDDGGMNSIELKWINSTAPMEKPLVSTRLDHR
ncbi:DUF4408 domain-containing protein, partial [Escherichia coli]|nr:DUF4408 domain-containing protein [Escherichia coli]